MKCHYSYVLFLIGFFVTPEVLAQSQQDYIEVDAEMRNKAILLTQEALQLLEEEKNNLAVLKLEAAIEADSTFYPAFVGIYNAGRSLAGDKSYLINYLERAKALFRQNDELCYYLGNIYQNEMDFENAIREYGEAIRYSKINGEDYPIVYAYYFNRANCFLKTQQYRKAITDYDYSLDLSPNNADIYTNRGYCHLKVQEKEKACFDWSRGLELGNPQNKKYLETHCR
ncbi:tetratricopeptide repeat protein [Pararhodonellum marinum]|uniref:tetratricopeptide repeat protein n=1 Tax=Pararhodonellum marinum TaxID=2755358 RepID=UPI00188DE5F5|nr:tetratricopeptide repeat protein [Pararhodonellum marinum]